MTWTYCPALHSTETVEALPTAFVDGIHHALDTRRPDWYTPADFPLAQLDQDQLNKITAMVRDINKRYHHQTEWGYSQPVV